MHEQQAPRKEFMLYLPKPLPNHSSGCLLRKQHPNQNEIKRVFQKNVKTE